MSRPGTARRRVEQQLRDELRDRAAPGELSAEHRNWPLARAALAQRTPERRRRRPVLAAAAAVVLAGLGLTAALTPAGAQVGEWFEERVGLDAGESSPGLAGFLRGGRLLAVSSSGAWVINPGGAPDRRLGGYDQAGWSPRGLYVVGTRGRRITAVEPEGDPRWSFERPGRVSHPAWSLGDGFRVAYLERAAGGTSRSLRVVGGDGRLDHLVRRGVAAVTPAWRPGPGYVLTLARPNGIATVDADSGRRLWSAPTGSRPIELGWSRDGRRLVVLTPRFVAVYGRSGRLLAERGLTAQGRARAMALHPAGRRAAVATTRGNTSSVITLPLVGDLDARSVLFTGPGSFEDLEWSPDGRRLLVSWPEANQWLLLGRGGRPRAFAGVSRQLDPAETGGDFPRLFGWCCAR